MCKLLKQFYKSCENDPFIHARYGHSIIVNSKHKKQGKPYVIIQTDFRTLAYDPNEIPSDAPKGSHAYNYLCFIATEPKHNQIRLAEESDDLIRLCDSISDFKKRCPYMINALKTDFPYIKLDHQHAVFYTLLSRKDFTHTDMYLSTASDRINNLIQFVCDLHSLDDYKRSRMFF